MNRRHYLLNTLACCLVMVASEFAYAESLDYQIKQGQVVPYRVTITAEKPTSIETLKGLIAFTGKGKSGENLTVEYKGGLTKSTRSTVKRTTPFGRFPGGYPGSGGPPRGPFDRPDFGALVQSTSTLVISPKGAIERTRGKTHLPYLLGQLSMLPFKKLPLADQTAWDDKTSLTITSKEESSRFGPRFGPFAPNNEETTTGGGESSTYKIEKDDGKLVTIRETYSMSSPAATSEDTGIQMKGSGTWIFDRQQGMSESMDFKVELTLQTKNVTSKIPVSVKLNRIPEQEYKDVLKQRADARAAAIAKAKQPAKTVKISERNKKQILSKLTHTQWGVVWGELTSLSRSRMPGLVAEDMDIMVLVAGLRSHSNSRVKSAAEVIWKKWGESFEKLASPAQKAEVAGTTDDSNPFVVESADMKGPRQWSDNTGRFKIEAEFVELDGTTVVLKGKDGKLIRVPKVRLTTSDQKLVERLAQ